MEVREPSARYLAKAALKPTEVGLVPVDWDMTAIGDFVTEIRGGAPLKPSDFTQSGIKVLPKGGVGRKGWLDVAESDWQFCSPAYADSHARNQVDESFTIVVLRDLVPSGPSIGLIVRIRERGRFVLAQGVYGFKVNAGALSNYLVHVSNTGWYRKLANSVMVGSTQVHITNPAFKSLRIPLPAVGEQQAIATALSDADALIESLEKLLAKKRQIKQGAMQELLTAKRRLPGFEGEWVETKLGEWGLCHRGVSYNPDRDLSAHDTDTSVRLLRSNNVQRSQVVLDDIQFVSVDRVSGSQRLRRNDVLICMANGSRDLVGKAAQFSVEDGFAYTFGAFMGAFRPNENADPNYVFYCFHSDAFRKHVAILLAGSSINNLTPSSIESCVIRAPLDKGEQTAISTILSDMDADIAALETKLAKARSIKQGMMQELLTGRIRLGVAE